MDSTSKRRLRVTADDFGFTPGVTDGILEAHEKGLVTHTSVMAGGLDVERALALAREKPDLQVGLHLTLTWGRPLSPPEKIPSLIDRNGRFFSLGGLLKKYLGGGLNKKEAVLEWRAQFERVTKGGLALSHVDSHHHIHLLPGFLPLAAQLAQEYDVPWLRRPREPIADNLHFKDALAKRIVFRALASRPWPLAASDTFRGLTLQGKPDFVLRLKRALRELPPGTTELMVHPGRPDSLLEKEDTCVWERERERSSLCDPELKQLVRDLNIQLDRTFSQADLDVS